MKLKVRLLLLWLAFIPQGLAALGINDVVSALRQLSPYASTATVSITGAGGTSAGYEVTLMSSATLDTLAPCNFLIETVSLTPDSVRAFTAYTAEGLCRFAGGRFTETAGRESAAPLRTVMFTNLLPAFIAEDIEQAQRDHGVVTAMQLRGDTVMEVELTTLASGVETARRVYGFRLPEMQPVSYVSVANIDTAGETMVEAKYAAGRGGAAPLQAVDRNLLEARHGEVMRRFAGGNLTPESYLGYALPPFTLPDMDGGRYTLTPGSRTLLMLLDDEADPEALESMRQTMAQVVAEHPEAATVDVVYIIKSRYTDAMRASDGHNRREHYLLGGAHLMKELGAQRLPLLMVIDEEGLVEAVAEGVNQGVAKVVIELLRPTPTPP